MGPKTYWHLKRGMLPGGIAGLFKAYLIEWDKSHKEQVRHDHLSFRKCVLAMRRPEKLDVQHNKLHQLAAAQHGRVGRSPVGICLHKLA